MIFLKTMELTLFGEWKTFYFPAPSHPWFSGEWIWSHHPASETILESRISWIWYFRLPLLVSERKITCIWKLAFSTLVAVCEAKNPKFLTVNISFFCVVTSKWYLGVSCMKTKVYYTSPCTCRSKTVLLAHMSVTAHFLLWRRKDELVPAVKFCTAVTVCKMCTNRWPTSVVAVLSQTESWTQVWDQINSLVHSIWRGS